MQSQSGNGQHHSVSGLMCDLKVVTVKSCSVDKGETNSFSVNYYVHCSEVGFIERL